MANTPKHDGSVLPDCNALYYFPEIPCAAEKDRKAQPVRARFVEMTSEDTQDPSASHTNLEDVPEVRGLIEKAFCKGIEQGKAEVAAAHQDTIETAAAALGRALQEATRIRMQEYERMEIETVRLSLAIAKKIIGHTAEHGQLIASVVKAAMKKVTDRRQLTVKLNPGDLATVTSLKTELQCDDDASAVIELEGDESIGKGGCIIEARLGDVDARIEEQIKIIEQMLTEQLPMVSPKN